MNDIKTLMVYRLGRNLCLAMSIIDKESYIVRDAFIQVEGACPSRQNMLNYVEAIQKIHECLAALGLKPRKELQSIIDHISEVVSATEYNLFKLWGDEHWSGASQLMLLMTHNRLEKMLTDGI